MKGSEWKVIEMKVDGSEWKLKEMKGIEWKIT